MTSALTRPSSRLCTFSIDSSVIGGGENWENAATTSYGFVVPNSSMIMFGVASAATASQLPAFQQLARFSTPAVISAVSASSAAVPAGSGVGVGSASSTTVPSAPAVSSATAVSSI